jgi:hypothetical protein
MDLDRLIHCCFQNSPLSQGATGVKILRLIGTLLVFVSLVHFLTPKYKAFFDYMLPVGTVLILISAWMKKTDA